MAAAALPLPPNMPAASVAGAVVFGTRHDAVACWPKNAVVAEIGVAVGGFTKHILDTADPTLFDAYDVFRLHEAALIWGEASASILNGKTHREFYEWKFRERMDSGRLRTFQGDSSTEIAKRDPAFYDVIYIDGDHFGLGPEKDVVASIPGLKPDGLLVFNDYVMFDRNGKRYGTINAVNKLCSAKSWRVVYVALEREGYLDIALTRAASLDAAS